MYRIFTFIIISIFIYSCSSNSEIKNQPNEELKEDTLKVVKNETKEEGTTPKVLTLEQQILSTEDTLKSMKSYSFGDVEVILTQMIDSAINDHCVTNMKVSYKGKVSLNDSSFTNAVGGDYGFSQATLIKNNLVLAFLGNYDGKTIIIDSSAKVNKLNGGFIYLDSDSTHLYSIYESDSPGFSIFNIDNFDDVYNMDSFDHLPLSFHCTDNQRILLKCFDNMMDSETVWEYEWNTTLNLMQVEINPDELNDSNALKPLYLGEAKCVCK